MASFTKKKNEIYRLPLNELSNIPPFFKKFLNYLPLREMLALRQCSMTIFDNVNNLVTRIDLSKESFRKNKSLAELKIIYKNLIYLFPHIKKADLSGHSIDAETLGFISHVSPLIKELRLNHCYIMPDYVRSLAIMISKLPRLKSLDLSANQIAGPGICIEKEYVDVGEEKVAIRFKAVKKNEYSNDSFYYLISVLEKSALKEIDFTENPLGEEALKFFKDKCMKNKYSKNIVVIFES